MEVSHVIGSSDHKCGQACCSLCDEDVGLYLGYHHVHLVNWYTDEFGVLSSGYG